MIKTRTEIIHTVICDGCKKSEIHDFDSQDLDTIQETIYTLKKEGWFAEESYLDHYCPKCKKERGYE